MITKPYKRRSNFRKHVYKTRGLISKLSFLIPNTRAFLLILRKMYLIRRKTRLRQCNKSLKVVETQFLPPESKIVDLFSLVAFNA